MMIIMEQGGSVCWQLVAGTGRHPSCQAWKMKTHNHDHGDEDNFYEDSDDDHNDDYDDDEDYDDDHDNDYEDDHDDDNGTGRHPLRQAWKMKTQNHDDGDDCNDYEHNAANI